MAKKKYDIITLGDCTIDAFIELMEARASWDTSHQHEFLTMSFADKIPYKDIMMMPAGNSNNVAVGCSRLGAKAAYYGTVGRDSNGEEILNNLKKEKVETKFMSVQADKPTNFHVALVYQAERTILIKHQDYKYKIPAGMEDTRWIYFSSIGQRGIGIHPQVATLLKQNPDIKMAFNPGTFQLRMGLQRLKPLFKRTEILFVNKEEAEQLLGYDSNDFKRLAIDLHDAGPKTVVITDAMRGSYCFDSGKLYYIGIFPHKPKEATGCGDAFATGFTSARLRDLPIEEAMRWGSRNGAGCATQVGPQAGLVSYRKMVNDLASHKKTFKAKILS